jgi:hypothetical protein
MKKSQNKILIFLSAVFIFNSSFYIQNCSSQWVHVTNGIEHKFIYSLANVDNYIFAGGSVNSYGVYVSSNNGDNWVQTSLNSSSIWSLVVSGNKIYAGAGDGVYLSSNNGTNWTHVFSGYSVYSQVINASYIFAGTHYGGVFASSDFGTTWNHTSLSADWVYSLAVNGNRTFAGTIGTGVYATTNNGTNWSYSGLNTHDIITIAVKENYLFAGTLGMYLSTDNGASWTGLSFGNKWVESFAVSGNYLIAGTSAYGVYITSDNGTSWILKNEGLVCNQVRSLCIVNNYIFAGTDSSVYRRPLGELVGINPISSQIPNKYELYQNYPNPFNPSTTIEFNIPGDAVGHRHTYDLRLDVYSVTGQLVATLVNENLQPGKYKVDWNASNYSSGIYFYTLETGDFSQTKRMVLLK